MKFYVSFGQAQVHSVDGVTLDKDILLEIEADSEDEARRRVWKTLGPEWSMMYTEDTIKLEYFPRGTVSILGV